MAFTNLPAEILLEVSSYLPYKSYVALRWTCRRTHYGLPYRRPTKLVEWLKKGDPRNAFIGHEFMAFPTQGSIPVFPDSESLKYFCSSCGNGQYPNGRVRKRDEDRLQGLEDSDFLRGFITSAHPEKWWFDLTVQGEMVKFRLLNRWRKVPEQAPVPHPLDSWEIDLPRIDVMCLSCKMATQPYTVPENKRIKGNIWEVPANCARNGEGLPAKFWIAD